MSLSLSDSGCERADTPMPLDNPNPKPDPTPNPRNLNARARNAALIDLSKQHPEEYRRYYLVRKREQYAKAGVPLNRRHVKHRDDGMGLCAACGEIFPCPPSERNRRRRNGNGGKPR